MPSYSARQVPTELSRALSLVSSSSPGVQRERDHTVRNPTGIRLYGEAFRLFLNTAGDD